MTALAPIQKVIVVNASQERCFRVFRAGIDKWWPRDHHIGSSPLKESRIEPHVGGRWFSTHEDGSESHVGKVLVWEPSSRLLLTWQITAQWKFDPTFVTEVELTFTPLGPKQTRVTLEHRKLEAYGVDAKSMHEMFSGDTAWVRTLTAFAAVAQEEV